MYDHTEPRPMLRKADDLRHGMIHRQATRASMATTSRHEDPSAGPEKASFNRMIDGFIAASPSYPPINDRAIEPNNVFQRQDQLHQYMQQITVATSLPSSNATQDHSIIPLHGMSLFRPSSEPSLSDRFIQPSNDFAHEPNHSFSYMQQPMPAPARRSLSSGTSPIQHREQDTTFYTHPFPPQHMRHPAHTVRTRILYQPSDDFSLSQYQCVVRQQIELFAANETDLEDVGSGRAGSIALGQVGLRCRHCAHLAPGQRARGATAYPTRLDVLYQTAQNLAKSHLELHCLNIVKPVRDALKSLREQKLPSGRGKQYWAKSAQGLGIMEYPGGLRFSPSS